MLRVLIVLMCAAMSASLHAGSYLRVISWNTLHAGWSGQTNWPAYASQMWQAYGPSSSSPNGFDVAFLQEVMYADSAAQIASALTAVSGYAWSHSTTGAIGRSSYKERYAVVYRTDRVQILSAYVWSDVGDKFEREPQIVKLRHIQTGEDYTFINWHAIFGTTAERSAEVNAIKTVFQTVQNSDNTDQDVLLLGDHNFSATAGDWNNLKSLGVSYRVNELTSLNANCAYASAYDHFWLQSQYTTEYSNSGRDYIANLCQFYNGVSDHAPIWLRLYSNTNTD